MYSVEWSMFFSLICSFVLAFICIESWIDRNTLYPFICRSQINHMLHSTYSATLHHVHSHHSWRLPTTSRLSVQQLVDSHPKDIFGEYALHYIVHQDLWLLLHITIITCPSTVGQMGYTESYLLCYVHWKIYSTKYVFF